MRLHYLGVFLELLCGFNYAFISLDLFCDLLEISFLLHLVSNQHFAERLLGRNTFQKFLFFQFIVAIKVQSADDGHIVLVLYILCERALKEAID